MNSLVPQDSVWNFSYVAPICFYFLPSFVLEYSFYTFMCLWARLLFLTFSLLLTLFLILLAISVCVCIFVFIFLQFLRFFRLHHWFVTIKFLKTWPKVILQAAEVLVHSNRRVKRSTNKEMAAEVWMEILNYFISFWIQGLLVFHRNAFEFRD